MCDNRGKNFFPAVCLLLIGVGICKVGISTQSTCMTQFERAFSEELNRWKFVPVLQENLKFDLSTCIIINIMYLYTDPPNF